MDFNIIDLIRLGFHGFAAAMLFMGFRLLNTVISKQDDDHSEDSRLELRLLLRSVRNFLWISLVFFLLGVASELLRNHIQKTQKNEMSITLQPGTMTVVDQTLLPTLINEIDGKVVKLNYNTSTFKDSVKNGQRYFLQIDLLNKEISDLRNKLNILQLELNNEHNVTDEGGISDEI